MQYQTIIGIISIIKEWQVLVFVERFPRIVESSMCLWGATSGP